MTDLFISNIKTGVAEQSVFLDDGDDLILAGSVVTGLTGPSGSGKTLLFRAIADLDPARGKLMLDSMPRETMPAHEWRSKVAYVPAESAWWYETVGDHFHSAIDLEFLAQLGFTTDVLDWQVSRLSSGEKQRLALLRCLAGSPDVLLLDEPTSSLDSARSHELEQVVLAYARRCNAAVFWISHDRHQLQRIAKQVYTIHPGGRIGVLH